MPFESRHARFGFPTDKWRAVPVGKANAHETSVSTSRLRTHVPGAFSVKVDTEVSSDQSRLVVTSVSNVRTSLYFHEKFTKRVVLSEQLKRKAKIPTGTLGRRLQFRATK